MGWGLWEMCVTLKLNHLQQDKRQRLISIQIPYKWKRYKLGLIINQPFQLLDWMLVPLQPPGSQSQGGYWTGLYCTACCHNRWSTWLAESSTYLLHSSGHSASVLLKEKKKKKKKIGFLSKTACSFPKYHKPGWLWTSKDFFFFFIISLILPKFSQNIFMWSFGVKYFYIVQNKSQTISFWILQAVYFGKPYICLGVQSHPEDRGDFEQGSTVNISECNNQ